MDQGTLASPPPPPKTPIIAVAATMCATSRNVTITPSPPQDTRHCRSIDHVVQRQGTLASPPPQPKTPVIAVASTMRATSRNVTITPTPTQDTHHCRSIDHVLQRQGTLESPTPEPKTPVIAVASTMRATSRNVSITPTPTQDTRHCRSIDHACNVKERYHHPHPTPRHPSLP